MAFSEVQGGPPPELVNPDSTAPEDYSTKFLDAKPTRK